MSTTITSENISDYRIICLYVRVKKNGVIRYYHRPGDDMLIDGVIKSIRGNDERDFWPKEPGEYFADLLVYCASDTGEYGEYYWYEIDEYNIKLKVSHAEMLNDLLERRRELKNKNAARLLDMAAGIDSEPF